jgi:hypothetical protein
MGISEDEFFETLGQKNPAWPEELKVFLVKAEAFDMNTDLLGGLSLKHASPTEHPLNMGYVTNGGIVDTKPSTWWDRRLQGRTYNETLAKLIGGSVIGIRNGEQYALKTAAGKMPRLSDLLPQHEQAWLDAMEQYIRECLAATPEG